MVGIQLNYICTVLRRMQIIGTANKLMEAVPVITLLGSSVGPCQVQQADTAWPFVARMVVLAQTREKDDHRQERHHTDTALSGSTREWANWPIILEL